MLDELVVRLLRDRAEVVEKTLVHRIDVQRACIGVEGDVEVGQRTRFGLLVSLVPGGCPLIKLLSSKSMVGLLLAGLVIRIGYDVGNDLLIAGFGFAPLSS